MTEGNGWSQAKDLVLGALQRQEAKLDRISDELTVVRIEVAKFGGVEAKCKEVDDLSAKLIGLEKRVMGLAATVSLAVAILTVVVKSLIG